MSLVLLDTHLLLWWLKDDPRLPTCLVVVSHQVGQQSSSTSRCWGERQPRAECFLSRL